MNERMKGHLQNMTYFESLFLICILHHLTEIQGLILAILGNAITLRIFQRKLARSGFLPFLPVIFSLLKNIALSVPVRVQKEDVRLDILT